MLSVAGKVFGLAAVVVAVAGIAHANGLTLPPWTGVALGMGLAALGLPWEEGANRG